jgi:hypothetical protein
MATFTSNDATTRESRWTFQTPTNPTDAPPRTPYVGSFNVPIAKERIQPNVFQWLVYKPQDYAIPPFEYFKNTRAPSRTMNSGTSSSGPASYPFPPQ